ncbi:MAG TPA: hypothetical protein VGP96_05695 [Candidatus Dormibacteraeota bacterium]|nr:hypothetical protein [Candidatus Dormibacteraeota bacterium]
MELVIDRLGPMQARYREIHADLPYLERVLARGEERASAVAQQTLDRVLELTGLR